MMCPHSHIVSYNGMYVTVINERGAYQYYLSYSKLFHDLQKDKNALFKKKNFGKILN